MTAPVSLTVRQERHGLLDQDDLDLSQSVFDAVVDLALKIQRRAVSAGRAAQGHFDKYGPNRPKRDSDSLYWVPPGEAQPRGDGFVIGMADDGKLEGWAGYRDYRSYLRLLGKLGKPHRYYDTGQLWRGLRVWQRSPAAFRLSFVGPRTPKRGRGGPNALRRNTRLSRILNSRSSVPILAAAQREVDELVSSLVRDVEGLASREAPFQRRKRLASVQRKARKLQKLRISL